MRYVDVGGGEPTSKPDFQHQTRLQTPTSHLASYYNPRYPHRRLGVETGLFGNSVDCSSSRVIISEHENTAGNQKVLCGSVREDFTGYIYIIDHYAVFNGDI